MPATDRQARAASRSSAIEVAVTCLVSAILSLSALDKVFHYEGFEAALRDYVLLPLWSAGYLAPPIVAAELVTGVAVIFPRWRRSAAVVAGILFTLFALILSINHLLGGRGVCGCWFTVTLAQGTVAHVLQNTMLALLAFSLVVSRAPGARPRQFRQA